MGYLNTGDVYMAWSIPPTTYLSEAPQVNFDMQQSSSDPSIRISGAFKIRFKHFPCLYKYSKFFHL